MDLIGVLSNATALFLSWLLLAAGFHKLTPANGEYYGIVFTGYGVRSALLSQQLPKWVGVAEVLLGIALLIPAARHWSATGAVLLLGGYFLLLCWQVAQGRSGMDCGCAGRDGEIKVGPRLLVRNLVLWLLALWLWLSVGNLPTVRFMAQDGSLVFWGMSLSAATVGVLVYLSAEQLMAAGQRIQQLKH